MHERVCQVWLEKELRLCRFVARGATEEEAGLALQGHILAEHRSAMSAQDREDVESRLRSEGPVVRLGRANARPRAARP